MPLTWNLRALNLALSRNKREVALRIDAGAVYLAILISSSGGIRGSGHLHHYYRIIILSDRFAKREA